MNSIKVRRLDVGHVEVGHVEFEGLIGGLNGWRVEWLEG